ncbi:5664_t:CDS:2, partial [Entrophospora sp. SA101]
LFGALVKGSGHQKSTGHTGCGGVKSCFESNLEPNLMKWLRVLFGQVAKPIDFGNNLAVQDQFVKNNVVNQMGNVSKIDFVKYAKQTIQVHGFVFDLKNGSLLK